MLSRVSPNRMRSPTLSFLAGRTSARQRQSSTRSMSVASIEATASPLTRTPSSRAAMTRVSLTTSASPGNKKSGKSRTWESVEAAIGADDEHSCAVARRGGSERNALGREMKIEGVDAHRGNRRPVEAVNRQRNQKLAAAHQPARVVEYASLRQSCRLAVSSASP